MDSSFANKILENLQTMYNNEVQMLKSLTIDTTFYPLQVSVISIDTANRTYYNRWIYNNVYLYQIGVSYPNNTTDSIGYYQIAKTFLNSFRIEDTDNFWFDKLENSTSPMLHAFVSKIEKQKEEYLAGCMLIGKSEQRGFYRGPFFRNDGALFLAFDNIDHPDSLLSESLLIIGKDSYSCKPKLSGQLFFVPKDNLPKERYEIKFGYLLKKDSLNECKEFYFQSLNVDSFGDLNKDSVLVK